MQSHDVTTLSEGAGAVRRNLILIGLGLGVWAVATLFFLIFGQWVLVEVGEPYFATSLFLLVLVAVLLLVGLSLAVRLKLFPERGSATRFGFAATAVGLLLDAFAIWHRTNVYPSFTDGQHHAFAVIVTMTYALCLIVPDIVDRLVRSPKPQIAAGDEEAGASAREGDEG